MPAQLTLHLGHRPSMGAEDFLVADCNAAAVAWIDRWPEWGTSALVVHGPPGSGKTHLAHVWRGRSGAPLLHASLLGRADPVAVLGGRPYCAIEGTDDGVNELALLHLFNLIAERRGSLLLTARHPPSRWAIVLPDLRSRLAAAPAVGIKAPDDTLLAALAAKLFADRQLIVPQEVIEAIVVQGERSFEGVRRLVAAIDQAALAAHRPVTAALVREVLRRDGPGAEDG